ncbi:MAG: peptidylprolyl isomerase [Nocardioides sp.]|nr:peptidylprolyl isomerase [Nocardioides sp.]
MLKRSLAILAALTLFTLAACSDDSSDDTSGTDDAASSDAASATCDYPSDGTEPARPVKAPAPEPTVSGEVNVTIKSNIGDLNLVLDADEAPCTVNSFVSLANQGFYDKTPCPRLGSAPGFGILQCGDPSGTTGGGPGYTVQDELDGDESYPAGTIAMANTGAPDTNGSQFFLVFADSKFDPTYTTFGTMDPATVKKLQAVGAKGDDGSNAAGGGAPNQPVNFTKVIVN